MMLRLANLGMGSLTESEVSELYDILQKGGF